MSKLRLATVWLDGCSGCHMSFLDIDERLITLAEKADLVYSPLVDTKEFPEQVDIALVEGAVSSEADLHKIKLVRERTKTLISLGDCGITANVPSMRNPFGVKAVYERAYLENVTLDASVPQEVVPPLLPRARPIHEIVPVDVFVRDSDMSSLGKFEGIGDQIEQRLPHARFVAVNELRQLSIKRDIQSDFFVRCRRCQQFRAVLNEEGRVEDARLHITQFRGFEKFCEGRPFSEMPSLMARICGICPVSHLMASAKACDALLAVRIPPTAEKLRRIFGLAQVLQSHALSFFHLSSPDLLLGMDSDPAKRNIFGVLEKNPNLAKNGIRLRQFGVEQDRRRRGRPRGDGNASFAYNVAGRKGA